ncbi:hypothetical protein [Agrobacterium rosae]|uniref:Uncharacterized protein n=1 Tax=Agrobacterium rosae TaxID=1972867 RepID=A0AAE5VMA2_9HYPH|nr:hypothetical protein [Agrobacterium rosae]KAA3509202.1 hypothetical protein DXM21_22540 [Agrobacterium rosae]KAA3513896.1 hypothetical protein DXM25_22730 [Agrobacterium rosae]MQB50915.1 hypothetical protein [Agrobacterium rosae]POO48870.1 hypothetical protein CPJ18_23120 [Agrobacterium rosae]
MNWVRFSYLNAVRSIERAYRESIKAFEAEGATSEQRWQRLRSEPNFDADDEETRYQAEHLGEIALQSEQSIKAVREAFALILYHYWEHQACFHLSIMRYNQDKVFDRASDFFKIDKVGIDRLRQIVNVLKHGNVELVGNEPELFDPSLIPQNPPNVCEVGPEAFHYRSAFRLSAADLDAAFVAIKASGPSGE